MVNRHKAKGTRMETAVVDFLRAFGVSVHRNVQHGAKDIGDIGGLDLWALECKDHRTHAIAEWLDQANREAGNAGKPYGAVIFKRARKPTADAYVLMDLTTFVMVLKDLERGKSEQAQG